MTDTFWLNDGNIQKVMPNLGQAIRSQISVGKSLEVAIAEYKKNKTRQQEKYAHACIGVIAKEMGENPAHLKARIKAELGLIEEIWHKGKVLTVERSTATLDRVEYGFFIEAIQKLAGYLNVVLPQPKFFGIDLWTY